jgi:hypothetical protein
MAISGIVQPHWVTKSASGWQALPWSCVYSHGVTKTFKLNYDKQAVVTWIRNPGPAVERGASSPMGDFPEGQLEFSNPN